MPSAPLNVAIIGLGNVGTGVARILTEQPDRIVRRAGRPILVRKAVVRDTAKPRDLVLPPNALTTDIDSVINDPGIDVAVELMGGLHPAREVVLRLLEAGKDVVTANKALIHEYGEEIFAVAHRLGRTVSFEAAVAGGIPIIAAVGQSLAANQIVGLQAILNGTSNFILSEMLQQQKSYADALAQAQALGYAEADPALDVDGTDAAQKLGILVQLAFGVKVPTAAFHVSGIDRLEQSDITYAVNLGYTIKLLATARMSQGQLQLSVRPTLVRAGQPLAQTHGPFNAVLLEGDVVGQVWFSGRGAGQMPTASAVTADIIDLAIGRAQLTFRQLDLWRSQPPFTVLPPAETSSRFYLHVTVQDRPHVMADVTHILGKHGISLASVIQPEAPEVDTAVETPTVPLIIMTHRTTCGQLAAAEAELDQLTTVLPKRVVMAVAD